MANGDAHALNNNNSHSHTRGEDDDRADGGQVRSEGKKQRKKRKGPTRASAVQLASSPPKSPRDGDGDGDAGASAPLTPAELTGVLARIEEGFRRVNARLGDMDSGLAGVRENGAQIHEKVLSLEASVRALENTSMATMEAQLKLETRTGDLEQRVDAAVKEGDDEDEDLDSGRGSACTGASPAADSGGGGGVKLRRPIRRNNTIGTSPHEAAKYRVSFVDDIKPAAPKPAAAPAPVLVKQDSFLRPPSPLMSHHQPQLEKAQSMGTLTPSSTASGTPLYSRAESEEEEDEDEGASSPGSSSMSLLTAPSPVSIARSRSVSDVNLTPPTPDPAANKRPSFSGGLKPPESGGGSLASISRMRSPFGSLKRSKTASGGDMEKPPPPAQGKVPTRSKSLKESSTGLGARLKKSPGAPANRFSWNSSSSSMDEVALKQRSGATLGSGLGGSIGDLGHALGMRGATSSVSLLDLDETSPEARKVTLKELQLRGDVLKAGLLDLKKTTGFKAYKSYYCVLTKAAKFYFFSSSVDPHHHHHQFHAGSSKDAARAKQAWHLAGGWTLRVVTADGKEVKKAEKRTRYFQLVPGADDETAKRAAAAPASSSRKLSDSEPTPKQFQAAGKDDALSWVRSLRQALVTALLLDDPVGPGLHLDLSQAQQQQQQHAGIERVATPVDKEALHFECDDAMLAVAR